LDSKEFLQKNNGKIIMSLFGLIYLIVSSAGGNNFTAHTFWVSVAFIISYLELNRMKSIESDLLNV
jgi:hypothetical protein